MYIRRLLVGLNRQAKSIITLGMISFDTVNIGFSGKREREMANTAQESFRQQVRASKRQFYMQQVETATRGKDL